MPGCRRRVEGGSTASRRSSVDSCVSFLCSQGSTRRENTNLSFAVRPKVDAEANDLVDGRVRPLVRQGGGEGSEREEGQAGLETPVQAAPREEAQRPLPCQEDEAEDEVERL